MTGYKINSNDLLKYSNMTSQEQDENVMGFLVKLEEPDDILSGPGMYFLDRQDMLSASPAVEKQIREIMIDVINHSDSLQLSSIVRYKLGANLYNTSSGDIFYVRENTDAGKKTFKEVVSAFCKDHNLGSVSIGYSELIYDAVSVRGMIRFDRNTDKTFSFEYTLDESLAVDLQSTIKKIDGNSKSCILQRLSVDRQGYMDETNILFNPPKINMPSDIMYPWFDETPEETATAFMNSNANVLLLYGDPGTGKTTYIKRMIQAIGFTVGGRSISVVDTPDVMESSALVNKIYTSKNRDIFIFEDVDRHLYSRTEGNDIMAGLLNAAEGLASPDVKIIITTNIKNLADVDSALIRPGRCFKTLEFLKLEKEQQHEVRNFLGLDVSVCTTTRQSLAEVMNDKVTDKVHTFGFGN